MVADLHNTSIVIACRNQAHHLRELLYSLIGQTRRPIEIVIVDDGSTDEARHVVSQFSDCGVVYQHEHHGNPVLAWQSGFCMTTGDVVLFSLADEILPPHFLEVGLRKFDARDVGAVLPDVREFAPLDGRAKTRETTADLRSPGHHGFHPGTLIRVDAIEVSDPFDSQSSQPVDPDDYFSSLFQGLLDDGWKTRRLKASVFSREERTLRRSRYARSNQTADDSQEVQRFAHQVTLCVHLTGRTWAWEGLKLFLERQTWPHGAINFLLVDSSHDDSFGLRVRHWLAESDYRDVRYVRWTGADCDGAEPRVVSDFNDRDTSIRTCQLFNRLRRMVVTEFCWILSEELTPPDDVLARLLRHISDDVAAVAAPYRRLDDTRVPVWASTNQRCGKEAVQLVEIPTPRCEVADVEEVGFGCIVIRSNCLRNHVFSAPQGEAPYFRQFFRSLGPQWRRLCIWDCECAELGPRSPSTTHMHQQEIKSRRRSAVDHGLRCSVVIPSHNYGHFLAEAIESVLAQTVSPWQVVVVDDASVDDTRRVAERFDVVYLRVDCHDAFRARKAGYEFVVRGLRHPETAHGDIFCVLDADDRLHPEYLERGLRHFQDSAAGMVTSHLRCFGDEEWEAFVPDSVETDYVLRNGSGVHAGTLARVSALQISRAFDAPPPHQNTNDDTWLWRNVMRHGFRCEKSSGVYYYRKHGTSRSTENRKHTWYTRSGLQAADVTILIPLSGRRWAWPTTLNWLQRQTWPHEQCRLVLCDTSQDEGFHQLLNNSDLSTYPDRRIIRYSAGPQGLADADRDVNRFEVQAAMCRIWQHLTQGVTTDWAFTLEDDHMPRLDVIRRLLSCVASPDVDAVVSPYKSRWHSDRWAVVKNSDWACTGSGIERVEGAGFGSMLVWSQCLKEHVWTIGPLGYDPLFTSMKDRHVLCDWTTHCEHLSPILDSTSNSTVQRNGRSLPDSV